MVDELEGLLRLAESEGVTDEWADEVATLLRQAFATGIPTEDFERVRALRGDDPVYGNEEPF